MSLQCPAWIDYSVCHCGESYPHNVGNALTEEPCRQKHAGRSKGGRSAGKLLVNRRDLAALSAFAECLPGLDVSHVAFEAQS
jgi:hypothetical protein